jgi:integrase
VSIPGIILPDLATHLDRYALAEDDSLAFTGPEGAPLRRSNFTRTWRRVTVSTGLTGFHFHDLRHTGNTLAGSSGASLRELMERMGHSSPRAALIYRHRSTERDQLVAAGMSKLAAAERRQLKAAAGTQRARRPRRRRHGDGGHR